MLSHKILNVSKSVLNFNQPDSVILTEQQEKKVDICCIIPKPQWPLPLATFMATCLPSTTSLLPIVPYCPLL